MVTHLFTCTYGAVRRKGKIAVTGLLLLLLITSLTAIRQSFDDIRSQQLFFSITGGFEARQTLYNANGIAIALKLIPTLLNF